MESSICEECKLNPYKYKCPGCSIRSCGLTCVKAHKQRTDCTGKRKLTEFVPLRKFDDNLLLSDYKMLEETKRVTESALRMRNKLRINPYNKLPQSLKSLQIFAANRGTKLWFLPNGMLKREKNQTRFDYRRKCISWTIEWRFQSTDVVLIDHGVGEDTNLSSVIENHLKPGPWIHKLKPFCDIDLNSLKLFIRQYPKGAKAPFKELNIKSPLRQQLAKVVILEYPVIHVYLPSHSYDFEVIKDTSITTPTTPNGFLVDASMNREEEIEDDIDSFEPKVLDLMKQMNCNNPSRKISEQSKVVVEEEDGGNNMEIEFDEEGLIDAYADIFADMDPSDYFNFECEFAKGFDSDDFNLEGIEEGEIVE